MKIKKSQAALGLTALVVISTVGMASVTLAAGRNHNGNNASATSTAMRLEKGNHPELTEAQKTEMEAKRSAEEAALKANDYNAWVTAVGANAPILEKITATNFSKYVELYNLHQQESALMTELGLEGNGHGMGMGRGMGLGLGLGQK